MAKRFTDTNKYKKCFFRNLPGPYKLLWDFLYHECDNTGIWHVDFDIAQIYIGKDMLINPETALRVFNEGEERIIVLDNGRKWFIRPFIPFQYGKLTFVNHMHRPILAAIDKLGLGPSLGLSSPSGGPMVGAMDKDKDKDGVKEVKKLGVRVVGEEDFNKLWDIYPKKDGRKFALRHFLKTVNTKDDLARVTRAVENYTAYIKKHGTEEQYIKNGSTFFNNWEDWEAQHGSNDSPSPTGYIARFKAKKEAEAARTVSPPREVSGGVRDLQDISPEAKLGR